MGIVPAAWSGGQQLAHLRVFGAVVVAVLFVAMGIALGGTEGAVRRIALYCGVAATLVVVSFLVYLWNNRALEKGDHSADFRPERVAEGDILFFRASKLSIAGVALVISLLLITMFTAPFMFHLGSPLEVDDRYSALLWWVTTTLPFLFVFPLGVLINVIHRRTRVGGIGLSPSGVYVYGWSITSFFPWWSVYGARAIDHNGPGIRLDIRERIPRADTPKPEEDWLGKWWLVRQGMRKRQLAQLGVHPALAFYAICFYLKHPEHRAELGTERAVERIRGLDMPDVIAEVEEHGDVRPEFWTTQPGTSAGTG